jgi:hypothetical protein
MSSAISSITHTQMRRKIGYPKSSQSGLSVILGRWFGQPEAIQSRASRRSMSNLREGDFWIVKVSRSGL